MANKPTTSYLIDITKSEKDGFRPYKEKARLQGRLDILEGIHNQHHANVSCGRRSHIDCENKRFDRFTCSIGKEIKMIRDALRSKTE